MSSTGPAPVVLVDACIWIFRAWFSLPPDIVDDSGRPASALNGWIAFVLAELRRGPASLGIAFDESLSRGFRHQLCPEYKAHRPLPDPDLAHQLRACRDFAEAADLCCAASTRYEADDLIAAAARSARAERRSVEIVSRDKDLLQLVTGDGDCMRDAAGRRVFDRAGAEARFGVPPQRIPDAQALAGDPVDGIRGVRGIGARTAARLVRRFGDLEGLFAALAARGPRALDGIRAGPALAGELAAMEEQVLLWRTLARAHPDVDVAFAPHGAPAPRPDGACLRGALEAVGMPGRFESAVTPFDRLARDRGGATVMRFLCDENLLGADAFFASLGEVVRRPGRDIRAADVAGADALLVRSQTRIDAKLLGAARPLFVGTATAGCEHVDRALLARLGIPFASAPGCNADSVADWVVTACVHALREGHLTRGRSTAAVIGCGAVGERVARRLAALGLETGICDPPRQAAGDALPWPWLEPGAALQADLVTLHVPLTRTGPHPTAHLLDDSALARLRPGAVLLNTARGGVVDDAALLQRIRQADLYVALDVHEHEPLVTDAMIDACRFVTPHIAGHSLDGKIEGTRMIHGALCDALGLDAPVDPASILPIPPPTAAVGSTEDQALAFVASAYDLAADAAALADLRGHGDPERRAGFDRLRRDYPARRDFRVRTVIAAGEAARVCRGAGFQVQES